MAVHRFLLSIDSRDIAWLPTSKTTEKVAYLRKRKRQKIMARTVYSQSNFRPKQVKGKKLIAASHTTGKNKLRNAAKPRHYASFYKVCLLSFIYLSLPTCNNAFKMCPEGNTIERITIKKE